MVEAQIFHYMDEKTQAAYGPWVRHSDYTALERQIAELRAKLDKAQARVVAAWNAFAGDVADDYAETTDVALVAGGDLDEQIRSLTEQRDNFEAENARLRALPLKDEVERVLEREWQILCEKDDRTSPAEYPDMALITRDELRDALLSRLQAGEQEEWRTLSSLPEKGLVIVGCYNGKGQWCAEVANVDYVREHLSEIVSGVFSTSPHLAFDYTHWMPLPAAPSDQGGDRG